MPPRSPGTSALRTSAPAATLAALLTTTGVAHLAVPAPFDAIVPRSLPGTPRFWTVASGVAELVVAAAVAAPRTRRLGAAAAAGLFVGVFPANVKMARDWSHRSPPRGPSCGDACRCRFRWSRGRSRSGGGAECDPGPCRLGFGIR
jgi:uncharacterized membrane protein